jgi:uncharacterized protein (TIGR03067 family)
MNLSLLFSLLACLTGPSQENAVKAELKKLEGTWNVTAVEHMGIKMTEEEVKKTSFVFQGDRLLIKKGATTETEAKVKLDPAKSPKTMDVTGTKGNGEGKTLRSIYELSGDTLRIGHGRNPEDSRPPDFNDKASMSIITLQRQK